MANKIFRTFDDTPEGVSRSVQPGLSRRYSCVSKYGLIIPNFKQFLYPGESIQIRPTSLIKTPAPLNRPQLSRVRFVQRFYALDLRTLWFPFEEYIKGTETPILGVNDDIEPPYVCNVSDSYSYTSPENIGTKIRVRGTLHHDTYPTTVDYPVDVTKAIPRKFVLNPQGYPTSARKGLAVFGVHELGDYLDTALHSVYSSPELDAAGYDMLYRTAFDFAAYQLIYSFGFRQPRVQRRTDDYYEMVKLANEGRENEFTPFTRIADCTGGEWTKSDPDYPLVVDKVPTPAYSPVDGEVGSYLVNGTATNLKIGIGVDDLSSGLDPVFDNKALSTDKDDINRTSWESVEHFPLKSGRNYSMLAMALDDKGFPTFRESAISLTRMRYANWTSDRFITATLSPQEGEEALIPVSGTVSVTLPDSTEVTLSGITASIPAQYVVGRSSTSSTDSYAPFINIPEENISDGVVTTQGSAQVTYRTGSSVNQNNNQSLVVPAYSASIGGSASAAFSSNSAVVVPSLFVSPSDFRFYMQLQHIKEMQQATDNRYKSFMQKFFGSHVPDSQLDRPLYLGGYVQDLNVTQVNQTSESGSSPLGSMAGQLSDGKTGRVIRFHSNQHSIVMGVCFIMPDTEYTGGENKEFVARDRLDWMLPQFANLSKQPIYNYELAYQTVKKDNAAHAHGVFGYEPPYNYLRWSDNRAVNEFRDTFNASGNAEEFKPWIVTRDFGSELKMDFSFSGGNLVVDAQFVPVVPTLSDEFLSMRFGVDDSNFAVDSETMYPFIIDSYFDVRAVRKIPSVGISRL